MRISATGASKIKSYEAFREYAYPDPYSPLGKAYKSNLYGFRPISSIVLPEEVRHLSGAPWTVGYGFIDGVTPNSRMSRSEADIHFTATVQEYEDAVYEATNGKVNQNQFDAMVCLAYNIGIKAFRNSTVLRCHNRGDYQSAARAFGLFNKSGGVVSNGLTSRRAGESVLYLQPVTSNFMTPVPDSHEMPQVVDAETSLTASPINKSAIVAGGSALAAAADQLNSLSVIKSNVDGLGSWLVPLLCVVVAGLCAYIVYQRYKQRKLGWA